MLEPREFLQAIGVESIGHGSRISADGAAAGSFFDHLTGTEDQLRGWKVVEPVCLAGLFHSIYGTEGFRGFILPLDERPRVASCIGDHAELLAFLNCVMDRNILDNLAISHLRENRSLTEPPAGKLRARPNEQTRMTGAEEYTLSADQFTGLLAVNLADHLEGWDNQSARPTTFAIPHAVDGAPGHYRIPPSGWFGYRRAAFGSMAALLGGAAQEDFHLKIAAVPPEAAAATWHAGETPAELRTPVMGGNSSLRGGASL